MAKAEKDEKKENKVSVGIVQFDLAKDEIWKSSTHNYPGTTDRGFEIETSNVQITFRMTKKDFYGLLDLLMDDVHTDYEEQDSEGGYSLEEFQDFIRSTISGDI